NARAYSVIPFDVIAGVTPEGRITGAKAVFHREPYVYQDPVRQPQLDTFLAAEAGQPLNGPPTIRPDYVAQSTITARLMRAAVRGNVLGGLRNFEDYRRRIPAGGHAFFMASTGPYDFHGSAHWRKENGFRFDRIRIVQEEQTIGFVHDDYQKFLTSFRNAPGTQQGFHAQEDAGLFILSPNVTFDPVKPWRMELLITTPGSNPTTVVFPIGYKLPASLILMPDEPVVAPWVEAWRDAKVNVAILS